MAAQLRIKRSAVPGRIPDLASLDLGELAVNTYDGRLYIKKTQGATSSIVQIGADQSISQLTDVDISNLQNGSLLVYNGNTSKWTASNNLEAQRVDAGFF